MGDRLMDMTDAELKLTIAEIESSPQVLDHTNPECTCSRPVMSLLMCPQCAEKSRLLGLLKAESGRRTSGEEPPPELTDTEVLESALIKEFEWGHELENAIATACAALGHPDEWNPRRVGEPVPQNDRRDRDLVHLCAEAAGRIHELESQVYAPGRWRCAKCEVRFEATCSDGDGTAAANGTCDNCPKCGAPLRPMTEREIRYELSREADEMREQLRPRKRRSR